jgi:hypothetical protein
MKAIPRPPKKEIEIGEVKNHPGKKIGDTLTHDYNHSCFSGQTDYRITKIEAGKIYGIETFSNAAELEINDVI